jgi:hypothetical protein
MIFPLRDHPIFKRSFIVLAIEIHRDQLAILLIGFIRVAQVLKIITQVSDS